MFESVSAVGKLIHRPIPPLATRHHCILQRVMNTWAMRDKFPEEVLDRQVGEVLQRRKTAVSIKQREIQALKRQGVCVCVCVSVCVCVCVCV